MIYIISGPPSRIRTSGQWNNDTYYSPLLFQLSYWWLRVPVRLELTTLRLLGVRSEPTELWDLGRFYKKKFHFLRASFSIAQSIIGSCKTSILNVQIAQPHHLTDEVLHVKITEGLWVAQCWERWIPVYRRWIETKDAPNSILTHDTYPGTIPKGHFADTPMIHKLVVGVKQVDEIIPIVAEIHNQLQSFLLCHLSEILTIVLQNLGNTHFPIVLWNWKVIVRREWQNVVVCHCILLIH